MTRKKLSLLILPITLSICFIVSVTIKNNYDYNKINNTIKSHINSSNIMNENDINILSNPDAKILTPVTLEEKDAKENTNDINNEHYEVKINSINNEKLSKNKDSHTGYYTYQFIANVTLKKDNHSFKTNIDSSVILEKSENGYTIKSTDDFKQDVSKAIISFKKDTEEDIYPELSNLSLLYQNDKIDISIHYPDYYTYSNNETYSKGDIFSDTVTFYPSTERKDNYIQIYLQKNKESVPKKSIDDYIKNGYTFSNETYSTNNGLKFDILKQTFIENNNTPIIEQVYISQKPYSDKNIGKIIITVRISEDLIADKQKEIDEIIKSIQ